MKLLWPHFVQGGHTQNVVHTDGMKRFIGWNRMGRDRALNESRRWTERVSISRWDISTGHRKHRRKTVCTVGTCRYTIIIMSNKMTAEIMSKYYCGGANV